MKTLANCKPSEFTRQGYRVAKKAKELFKKSNVLEIRKHMPEFTGEEDEETKKQMIAEQGRKNMSEMIDVLMDKYPDETTELLGMMCFIEPEDLDNHNGFEILGAGIELLKSKEVLDFLSLLMK